MTKVSVCPICLWTSKENEKIEFWDHCPNCLSSRHEAENDEFECGGRYRAISIWVRDDKESWDLIQRCDFCGKLRISSVSENDNPLKLTALISNIMANPPFPIERIEELTYLMGGQGDIGGYYGK